MYKGKEWLKEKVRETARYVGHEYLYINIYTALELIDQLDEPEKVVVPEFVGEWIEESKKQGEKLYHQFGYVIKYGTSSKRKNYLFEHSETFARAWLDGYEVEKEPKYYVLDKNEVPILIKLVSDSTVKRANTYCTIKETNDSKFYQLTEQEIKDYDERFWAFAVPVEEL